MPIQSETREIVYRHPKGRFNVVERRGKGRLGGKYRIREVVYPRPKTAEIASKSQPAHQKYSRITKRDQKRLKKLYKQGYSVQQISRITGWSDAIIYEHLKRRKKSARTTS